jgi:hypothetical protein
MRQRYRNLRDSTPAQQGLYYFLLGYQLLLLFARLTFLHAETSLRRVTTKGTATGAKRGVYTAYLCSAGKYSNANIPGLKNAREASVSARLECCRADAGTFQTPA